MSHVIDDLRAGMVAAQAGKRDEARAWFIQVLQSEPRNETAWLWLSSVMPTTEQASKCIDHLLSLNPANDKAHEAKEILRVRMLLEEATLVPQTVTRPGSRLPQGTSHRLGELLIEQRVLSQAQLEKALAEQQRQIRQGKHPRLGEVLLNSKLIRREQLAAALRTQIEGVKDRHGQAVEALGEYLVRANYITAAQLAHALAEQSAAARKTRHAPRLGDVLIKNGFITRIQLERALSDQSREYDLQFR